MNSTGRATPHSKDLKILTVIWNRLFRTTLVGGREEERHRRVVLTALASIGAKGVNVLTLIISVPLAIHYLGTERFGLWMTISSVVAVLGFADLGIGNGLLNAIAEANGKEDSEGAKRYVSSSFFLLSALAAVLGLLFALSYPYVPWDRIFNVKSSLAASEAGPSVAAFVFCFLLSIPLGIVQKVQIGYQEGYLASFWQGAGNFLGLLLVIVSIVLRFELPWIVLSFAGAPVITGLINSTVMFGRRRPWLSPRWRYVEGTAVRRVLNLGLLFFVLQIAAAIAFSSDNIIIAQLMGPIAVSEYSVSMRLFSLAPMFLGYFLMPLWPAYGESIARGEIQWTKRTLIRSLKITFALTGSYSLVLVLLGRSIIRLWAGPSVVPSYFLLAGLAIWTVSSTLGNAVAMFLNGCNRIGFQAVSGSAMAIAAVCAKIVFGRALGLAGVIWGTFIAYAIFTMIPFSIYLPHVVNQMTASSET